MHSRFQVSLKQLLVLTTIAGIAFAYLLQSTATPTTTLESLRENSDFDEFVIGGDISGRFISFGGVVTPKGGAVRASGDATPLCTFNVDGKVHKFRQGLPGEHEYRILLVKPIDTGEYEWVVYRRK